MQSFDVVVIGAGTGGQTAAVELAAEGFRVAVVEHSATPGGICALHGCQAKKYYYEVAELAAKAKHLEGLGISAPPGVNWAQITAAKNKFTAKVPENTVASLKGNGISYLSGSAAFEASNILRVAAPTEIIILEALERPLGPFDGDMVQQLVEASIHDGINVRCGVKISVVEKTADGFAVHLDDGELISADLVINGAGRTPAVDGLQLENAGVDYSRAGIHVDKGMRSSVDTIFAVGDCAATLMLARVADREALAAAHNILAAKGAGEQDLVSYAEVPAVLFTYPQLAMVGKTEEQLKAEQTRYWKSTDTRVGWPTYRRVGLSYAAYKILVDEHDHVLGAHILSDNATGLINTFRMAMLGGIDVRKLRQESIMSPYPSRESDLLYMLDPLVQ
ncbi:MAG: NAD(P)/FAD-dependent oxidoreductase [Desulfofustis sp.]